MRFPARSDQEEVQHLLKLKEARKQRRKTQRPIVSKLRALNIKILTAEAALMGLKEEQQGVLI